ncbi:MAG: hypothetical protein WCT16_01285 [Candidatus Buchananbacteria bacterium]
MALVRECSFCSMTKVIMDHELGLCHTCCELISKKNKAGLAVHLYCFCRLCKKSITKEDEHFAVCKSCAKKIRKNWKRILRGKKEDEKQGIRRFA